MITEINKQSTIIPKKKNFKALNYIKALEILLTLYAKEKREKNGRSKNSTKTVQQNFKRSIEKKITKLYFFFFFFVL